MKALWLHVRNSPLRWALPVLVTLDLAVLLLRGRHWIGVWPETGAAGQIPAYLVGVLGAGASAWASAAPTRHGVAEQLSASRVHPALLEGHRLAATAVIMLVPYLLGQLVAGALTVRTNPPGVHLFLGYLAHGVFVTLLCVCLGWAVGKLFGSVLASLVASLGCLVLMGLMDQWTGFIVLTGRPDVAIDPGALLLRFGMIAVLLVTLPWMNGGPRRTLALVPVPAFLGIMVVLFAAPVVVDREPPGDDAVCVAGRTTLCLWPEHEKYLPVLRELGARLDRLPAAFTLPPRINEFGVERVRVVDGQGNEFFDDEQGPPFFYILEGSPWSSAGDIGTAISAETFTFEDRARCAWGGSPTPTTAGCSPSGRGWRPTSSVAVPRTTARTRRPGSSRHGRSAGRSPRTGPSTSSSTGPSRR
ncbi:hypothetical protein ACFQY4_22545 [Catellatospora bangladeshensis]|uniref:hypothetical protein n=1 Tax=Catellatospora bangladeshensis TaxID=310355 RepID=UPI00361AE950